MNIKRIQNPVFTIIKYYGNSITNRYKHVTKSA